MGIYKIEIKIKSPLATPIQGDTLFGHICWGIYYHKGEQFLTNFLDQYKDNPPLIISNGFPHNKLPIPLLTPTKPKLDISLEKLQQIKNKKFKYIDSSYFLENKTFSEDDLFNYFNSKNEIEKIKTTLTYHNTIDRYQNRTLDEGGFYFSSEIWYSQDTIVDIYIFSNLEIEKVEKYFIWGIEGGYGADKSIGKGNLELINISAIDFPKNGNRFMSLGHFIPNNKKYNLKNLKGDIFVKYGKLGGNFTLEKSNPFKKPLIMFKEGTSFEFKNKNLNYIGVLISNIHNDAKIKHHALAPLIRFNEEIE